MRCLVKDCKNVNRARKNNTKWYYFPFPKDEDLFEKWINFCGTDYYAGGLICHAHFAEKDLKPRNRFKPPKILPNACPTISVAELQKAQQEKEAKKQLSSIAADIKLEMVTPVAKVKPPQQPKVLIKSTPPPPPLKQLKVIVQSATPQQQLSLFKELPQTSQDDLSNIIEYDPEQNHYVHLLEAEISALNTEVSKLREERLQLLQEVKNLKIVNRNALLLSQSVVEQLKNS